MRCFLALNNNLLCLLFVVERAGQIINHAANLWLCMQVYQGLSLVVAFVVVKWHTSSGHLKQMHNQYPQFMFHQLQKCGMVTLYL